MYKCFDFSQRWSIPKSVDMYTNIKDLNVKLPYHGSEVRMIEDVTVVVDSKRISIDSKLHNKKYIFRRDHNSYI